MRRLVIAPTVKSTMFHAIAQICSSSRHDGDCVLSCKCSGHRQKSAEREVLCHLVEAASCDVSGGVMAGVVCSALAAADEVNMERWINSQVWQERCRLCVQRNLCGTLLNTANKGPQP
jgi:hypothetical protein